MNKMKILSSIAGTLMAGMLAVAPVAISHPIMLDRGFDFQNGIGFRNNGLSSLLFLRGKDLFGNNSLTNLLVLNSLFNNNGIFGNGIFGGNNSLANLIILNQLFGNRTF